MHDTIVVGGGIVGASVGYHLARAGEDALLIDRDDAGRATDAGAGIVAPEAGGRPADARGQFAVDAAAYYPELVGALEAAGEETGYAECGTLVVAVDGDEEEPFARALSGVADLRAETGSPSEDALYELSSAEARERFPPLAEVRDAYYYEGGARVDGRLMNRALVSAGEAAGIGTLAADVEEIMTERSAVTGVVADGEEYGAENVVVAGGAWSDRFADRLGVDIPVEPQRGQIAHLGVHGDDTAGWPVVKAFRDHYMVPWADGRVAAGATREAAGFEPRTTAAGVREVLSEALRVAPGLADASLREVRVGLRPLSADGDPVIGPAGPDGAYVVTGHGPSGLTLGPYSGKLVADMVLGEPVEADLSPFDPGRFD